MLGRFVLAASLIATPAIACVQSQGSNSTQAFICTSVDTCRTVLYSDLGNGSTTQKADRLRQTMQDFLDTRVPLLGLDALDPDKADDPGLNPLLTGRMFWSDIFGVAVNGNPLLATHVTSRACVVQSIVWTGQLYFMTVTVAGP